MDLEKKAIQLSNQLYNRGLDKAQIRDLSGAVELLRQSLQFNKNNINARNLLGLVYFEIGEAVAALSEWVISKNLQPQDNIASQYIDRLQSNQAKLSVINQTIRDYNIALENCRHGDEDIAAISLKKVIAQNAHFIKAYHLLALIYIRMERYTRARKLLRKAIKIDATNATTLRFLKAIDEQTGQVQRTESRRSRTERQADEANAAAVVPFRERAPIHGLINLLIGLAIGILAMWIVIVPSIRQSASRDVNERLVEYTNTIAVQENQIHELESAVDASKDSEETARQTVESAQKSSEGTDKLLKAYVAYQDGRYTDAADLIADIDRGQLSADARAIYDTIYNETKEIVVEQYKTNGMDAFDYERWPEAIEYLEKARALDDENYTVLDYLALAYMSNGDSDKAIEVFRRIIELFPDTRRASSAEYYITQLGGTVDVSSGNGGAAGNGGRAGTASGEDAGTDTSGAGDDGSYDDGSYDDGSYDDESYDDGYDEAYDESYDESYDDQGDDDYAEDDI